MYQFSRNSTVLQHKFVLQGINLVIFEERTKFNFQKYINIYLRFHKQYYLNPIRVMWNLF